MKDGVRAPWRHMGAYAKLRGLSSLPLRLGGVVTAIGLAVAAQFLLQNQAMRWSLALYGAAAALLFILLRSDKELPPVWLGLSHPEEGRNPPLLWAKRIFGACLVVAVALAVYAWTQFDFGAASSRAWMAYALAVSALLIGACAHQIAAVQYRFKQKAEGMGRDFELSSYLRQRIFLIVGLLVVIIAATGLRVYALDRLPFGTWYDEAANGLEALRIANEPDFRPVYNNGVNSSGHYLFLIVLFFDLFGVETESIRLISALMGVGLVVAGYGVGHMLFGPGGGLIFAFLLAVSRWAINFSRIGMYNISTPLLALTALFFLVRGVRSGRLSDYALAGLAAGVGLTFYSAYLLFTPVLGLVIVTALIARFSRRAQGGAPAWLGILVLVVACGVSAAPIAKFALVRPTEYFSRVRTTSLLEHTAPEERMTALASNTRQHLRMFHVRGDPNGRHNLPGAPMLDPITGGLMILGLVVCLARPRDPLSMLLPAWLGTALLGGILSLDFESPQSLRSIGALPPAYLLATLPLIVLAASLSRSIARRGEVDHKPACLSMAGRIGVVALILVPAALMNVRTYFVAQAQDFASWNAFSTPETLAARILTATPGVANGTTAAYVISLFDGHPTIRFLTPDVVDYHRLETTDTLPIVMPETRDILIIADAERGYFYEEARLIYPDARFEAIQPPFGGPTILYTVHISAADQRAIQGLQASYYAATTWDEPTMDDLLATRVEFPGSVGWPDNLPADIGGDAPFLVEWEGALFVPNYGPHMFHVEAPGHAEVYLGDELAAMAGAGDDAQSPAAAIVLAEGLHALRIRALYEPDGEGAGEHFGVSWRPPDRDWESLPAWLMFHDPVRVQGLWGRYFPNGDWTPPEAFARIDGRWEMYFHVLPLPRPYTVEWRGQLTVPASGTYAFAVQSTDESALWINDEEVARSDGRNITTSGHRYLNAGRHEVVIRYADRTHHTNFRLYWEPPDGSGRRIIPASMLSPPQNEYERLAFGPPFRPPSSYRMSEGGGLETIRAIANLSVEEADAHIIVDDLVEPTAVALGADGVVWVAEPRAGRVRGFSQSGQILHTLERGADASFEEPYAVAVDAAGTLLVLDAGAGIIHRFRPSGEPLSALAVESELLLRSRGLSIDARTNDVWIAATARGVVARADGAGQIAQIIPQQVGGDLWDAAQPVGVAAVSENLLFVTDAGTSRLVLYAANGEADTTGGIYSQRLMAWEIPRANTYFGPQLAVDPAGIVYRSAPEEGLIVAHSVSGEALGAWQVRSPAMPATRPVGLAVEESGIIWFVDSAGHLLRVELDLRAHLPEE